ncbi:Oidioi.mRNA.OKI2018_I69.PAR.g10431.t1.cds [Oikopleura dioica]|nr:Oidioi.mRNA.OKI2018_I69.PAR.g10431.t1.cds [Oikopleura dioica]
MSRILNWFKHRRRRYRKECPAQQVSNQPIQTAPCPSNAPAVPTMVPSPPPMADSPPTSWLQEFIAETIGPQQYFDVQEVHQQGNSSGGNSPNESGCYYPPASAPVPEAAQEQIYSAPINPPFDFFSPEDTFQQYFTL